MEQCRSSRPEMFCKKRVLRNFTKLTGKQLFQSLICNKVAGLRPAPLLKKRLWHRCLPVNFVKFPRTPFYIEYLCWLLLTMIRIDSVSRKNILKVALCHQVKFYQRHHNFFGNLYKIMTSIEFFKVTCFSYVLLTQKVLKTCKKTTMLCSVTYCNTLSRSLLKNNYF